MIFHVAIVAFGIMLCVTVDDIFIRRESFEHMFEECHHLAYLDHLLAVGVGFIIVWNIVFNL